MAYDFEGTAAGLGSLGDVDFPAYPFTVSCWVKPDAFPARSSVALAVGPGFANQFFGIQVSASIGRAISIVRNGANVSEAVGTTTLSTTSWTHVAARITSTVNALFVNGALQADAVHSVIRPTVSKWDIGLREHFGGPSEFLDGSVGEFAVYRGFLAFDEIGALSRGVTALQVRPDLLTHYFPLIRGLNGELRVASFQQVSATLAVPVDHVTPSFRRVGELPFASLALRIVGTGAGNLPAFAGAGSGDLAIVGSGAGVLPAFLGAGAGDLAIVGAGAGTLPAFAGAGFGGPIGPSLTSQFEVELPGTNAAAELAAANVDVLLGSG